MANKGGKCGKGTRGGMKGGLLGSASGAKLGRKRKRCVDSGEIVVSHCQGRRKSLRYNFRSLTASSSTVWDRCNISKTEVSSSSSSSDIDEEISSVQRNPGSSGSRSKPPTKRRRAKVSHSDKISSAVSGIEQVEFTVPESFDSGVGSVASEETQRLEGSGEDLQEQQYGVNIAVLNMEGLFNWLLPKTVNANASSQQLLVEILGRDNTFLTVSTTLEKIRNNTFLMKNKTADDLFSILIANVARSVRAELADMISRYHDVLGILTPPPSAELC